MDRIVVSPQDVADPVKLRIRLDQLFAQTYQLLQQLDALKSDVGVVKGDGLTDAERRLISQLAVGSTSNSAPPQNALIPRVTSLPPAASSSDGQMVQLSTDGQVYRFDGTTQVWSTFTTGTHNLLSATHPDTVPAAVVRGDVIVGNATPKWARLAIGTAFKLLRINAGGTDPEWGAVDDTMLSANVPLLKGLFESLARASNVPNTAVYTAPASGVPRLFLVTVYICTAATGAAGSNVQATLAWNDGHAVKSLLSSVVDLTIAGSTFQQTYVLRLAANQIVQISTSGTYNTTASYDIDVGVIAMT